MRTCFGEIRSRRSRFLFYICPEQERKGYFLRKENKWIADILRVMEKGSSEAACRDSADNIS